MVVRLSPWRAVIVTLELSLFLLLSSVRDALLIWNLTLVVILWTSEKLFLDTLTVTVRKRRPRRTRFVVVMVARPVHLEVACPLQRNLRVNLPVLGTFSDFGDTDTAGPRSSSLQ